MKKYLIIAALGLSSLFSEIVLANPTGATTSYVQPLAETPEQHDARMAWWREARFGMFIHWGLYSQAAGYWNGKPVPGAGEWAMNDLSIPVSQYAKLVPEFDPEKFDADTWVKTAKDAGMKYIVITTKHHDGFGMYPSALTDWCIKSTRFKRDPLKELAAACRKQDIKLCFYYSIMDWYSPVYEPRKPWNDVATNRPDFEAYDNFMKGQLKELLSNYGPIGLLWFDGDWQNTWTYERGVDLYNYLRGLQPTLIINNRVGSCIDPLPGQVRPGDYQTPEQSIPPNGFGRGVDWETCMTMNDTWGYKRGDETWKSTDALVRNLIDCASKGGNYLLNVGPTEEGLIPGASIDRLRLVGEWMKVNGEAIYGTSASPFFRQLPWGRCTARVSNGKTTLYLHVFDWPSGGELLVPGLMNHVDSAKLLDGGKSLAVENRENSVAVTVPPDAPNKISSTIVLQFSGSAEITNAPVMQNDDGSIALMASDAILHGNTFRYEAGGPLDDIGYWTNPEDWTDWEFQMQKPGKFEISATIAAPALTSFEVSIGGQNFQFASPVTTDYMSFKSVKLGVIDIPKAGKIKLAVRPVKSGWQPMNLKGLRLTLAQAN